jgi:hypothetical protein
MKRLKNAALLLLSLSVLSCASAHKKADLKAQSIPESTVLPQPKSHVVIQGRLAELIQEILPPGWPESYEFALIDQKNNYVQMNYQSQMPVDFYLFKGKSAELLLRVDWDCKLDCTEGISAYRFENGKHEEITFKATLTAKVMKKIGPQIALCVGPKFHFGSMWMEKSCRLGFEFSKTGGVNAIYSSGIKFKDTFHGKRLMTLKWNSKKLVFE